MTVAIKMAIILIVVIALFIQGKFSLAGISLAGALACGVFGIIDINTVFSTFSNATILLIMGMMIVGGSLFHTGLAREIGNKLHKISGGNERVIMLICTASSAILAIVSNGPTALVTLFPIVTSLCLASDVPVSKVYLPFVYGIGFGSCITLTANTVGPVTASVLTSGGYEGWSFFEIAQFGVPVTIVGFVVLYFIGFKVLPDTGAKPIVPMKEDASADPDGKRKMIISGLVMCCVFIGMVFAPAEVPTYVIGFVGVLVLLFTGTIDQKQMFDSIAWPTIFLIAGMMTVATGVSSSGLGELVASAIGGMLGENAAPILVVAVVLLTTTIFTQFLSNTAAALIMGPIAFSLSSIMGVAPQALLMAVYIGCLSSFCTPMAAPAFAYVFEPGGYSYRDYFKAGLLMQATFFVVAMIVIPIFWL